MSTKNHRRIQDDIESKNATHMMNLDRRLKLAERRNLNYNYHYDGPARRLTIERRLKIHDRRGVEG